MNQQRRYRRRVANRVPSCMGLVVRGVVLLGLLVVLYFTLVRPQLSQLVAEQVVRQAGLTPVATVVRRAEVAAPMATSDPAAGAAVVPVVPRSTPEPRQAEAPLVPSTLPNRVVDLVAALPRGRIEVTEDEANGYLAANPEAIAPLDSVHLRFVPGQILVTVRAFGMTSEASAAVRADEGRIVVVDPKLDGPLGLVLSPAQLVAPLEAQLNAALAEQGQQVRDVQIEQGKMIVVIE